MHVTRPTMRLLLALLIVAQSLMPPVASAGEFLGRLKRLVGETAYHGTAPELGYDGAMETLAENIDWLEHHIDTYGSVVAKQPDIWGEARLTKHRDEYERMMFGELNQFGPNLNASIAQGDSSFLAQAFALSAAVSGTGPAVAEAEATAVGGSAVNAKLARAADPDHQFTRLGFDPDPAEPGPAIELEPVIFLNQMTRYLNHLHELRRINEGDDTSDSPGYSLNLVRIPVSILPGKLTREGFGAEVTITAEPVISDDLLPTTFHNLAVNDVVDFLGLPIVRITERLQDEQFKEGLRAEDSRARFAKTILEIETAYEKFNCDKNKTAFDDSVAPVVSEFFNNDLAYKYLLAVFKETLGRVNSNTTPPEPNTTAPGISPISQDIVEKAVDAIPASALKSFRDFRDTPAYRSSPQSLGLPNDGSGEVEVDPLIGIINAMSGKDEVAATNYLFQLLLSPLAVEMTNAAEKVLDELVKVAAATTTAAPTGRTRRALNPLNPSSLMPVIGIENLVVIAEFFEPAYYGRYIRWAGGPAAKKCDENRVDLLDAQRFLQAEIEAAYELLAQPAHVPLLAQLAAPDSLLATQIRSGHFAKDPDSSLPRVDAYRRYFFQQLHNHGHSGIDPAFLDPACVDPSMEGVITDSYNPLLAAIALADPTEKARNSVEALAWALVVESALLNDRLNQDVRKLAEAKQAFVLDTPRDYWFFLPDTVMRPGLGLEPLQAEFQLATEVFKQYVRVRWPIHVFAVDPVNQDQNVADVSQRKRELQFAMALGFATGQIGGNSLTQFSRQMETQVETISLNQTVVGFGHGADTFGWRFYPRVQALPVPGTLGVLRETLCGTSRDYDLCHRSLEPGQRECTAVVLMPSFVPYADFDIRTNWFKLTNPKNAALTMKDTLKLSRAVTAMRNSRAQCAECQHLYRDGELGRLFKRVEQLDRELPLQTQRALVPYENTLGGFEMFNTGVTDLAPELVGWYGAPGVNVNADFGGVPPCVPVVDPPFARVGLKDPVVPFPVCPGQGTTLFLVGDNFSVHDTKVIAGGVCIPNVRLISRELMQVTIPPWVNVVKLCENGDVAPYVSVYVATPYGVTNHLHVPVHAPPIVADVTLLAAVKAEVTAQIAGLDIPPAVTTVVSKDDQKILATATKTIVAGTTRFTLRRDLTSPGRYASLEPSLDPRLAGKTIRIKASVMKDENFIIPLQDLGSFPVQQSTSFEALGNAINPHNYEGDHQLLRKIVTKLESIPFPADGTPLKLKIVYYASFDQQIVPTRLKKEIQLEISLVDNCGCEQPQASIKSSTHSLVNGHDSSPVRFAQLLELEPERIETPPGEGDVLGVAERFNRLEAKLDATLQLVAGLPDPLAAPVPVAVPSGPPQVTVNVVSPTLADQPAHHRRHHDHHHPLLNRMKVEAGEHWRNVRDKLPCN